MLGAFLAGLAVGWTGLKIHGLESPVAEAAGAGAASSGEMIALTSDAGNGSQVLYLIDPAEKVISAYEFDARKAKLKLAAVRHFEADHRLSEFNNEPPSVADIENLVRPRQGNRP